MAFAVEIKRKTLKSIEGFDDKRKLAVRSVVLILKNDPVPFRKLDVVKLKGYDNIYRIRIGNFRVVYAVLWTERKILVHYVGPRGGAYG